MEAVKEIIAQMRKPSIYKGNVPVSRVDADFRYFADKLESAITQTPQQEDNTAKLREAVEAVVAVGYPHNFQIEAPHIRGYCYEITPAIRKCFDALSASPRNCDLYKTLDDARNAFFADYVPDETCSSATAFATWLFDEVKGEPNGRQ